MFDTSVCSKNAQIHCTFSTIFISFFCLLSSLCTKLSRSSISVAPRHRSFVRDGKRQIYVVALSFNVFRVILAWLIRPANAWEFYLELWYETSCSLRNEESSLVCCCWIPSLGLIPTCVDPWFSLKLTFNFSCSSSCKSSEPRVQCGEKVFVERI